MPVKELYEQDFHEWAVQNAALLREGRLSEADFEHIAEELEDMSRRERRAMESRLSVLLAHLLKWQAQPDHRSSSWRGTLRVQRRQIGKLLHEMPSLRASLLEDVRDAYDRAMIWAAVESNLPEEDFPPECPFTLEQILDEEFLPS
jgi:hypothetical protein